MVIVSASRALVCIAIGIMLSSMAHAVQSPSQLLETVAASHTSLDNETVEYLSIRVAEIVERHGSEPWASVAAVRREGIQLSISELLGAVSRLTPQTSSEVDLELANFEISVMQYLNCPVFDAAQSDSVLRQGVQVVDAVIAAGSTVPLFEGTQVLSMLRGKLESRFQLLPNSPFSPAYKVPLSTEELQSLCSFSSETVRSLQITNELVPGWEQKSPAERELFLQENADRIASLLEVWLNPVFARYAELSIERAELAHGANSICTAMTTPEATALIDRVAQGYQARSRAEFARAQQQSLDEASRAAALAAMAESLVNE